MRMNIFVVILCLVMGRPYQFYYFVPLVTFWFLVLYVVLLVYPKVTAELVKGNSFIQYFDGIYSCTHTCIFMNSTMLF